MKKDTTNPVASSSEPAPKVQAIALLTEEHGFVLGIRNSGFDNPPYAVHVLRRNYHGRLVDPRGKKVDSVMGHPIFAYTVPHYTDEDVAAALAQGNAIAAAEAAKPELEGDVYAHLHTSLQIIHELSEAIGPRRAMLKLHQHLGDNIDGPRLPMDVPHDLHAIRKTLTKWVREDIGDEPAISTLRDETYWSGSN